MRGWGEVYHGIDEQFEYLRALYSRIGYDVMYYGERVT